MTKMFVIRTTEPDHVKWFIENILKKNVSKKLFKKVMNGEDINLSAIRAYITVEEIEYGSAPLDEILRGD